MPNPSEKKVSNKKHLARLEKERRYRLFIIVGSAVVLGLVVLLIGYGILDRTVLQARQPVAIVGDSKVTVQEFQENFSFQRYQLIQQYNYLQQNMQLLGSDPNLQAYMEQQLSYIQAQLADETLGQQVIDSLISQKIIEREAAKLGITASQADIDKRIEENFGYYAEGSPPTPTTAPTTAPTSTLSSLQETLVPPTSTPTEAPTSTPDLTTTATPTAAATATEVPTSTPSGPTPTSGPTVTSTPYTYEAFQKSYQEVIDKFKSEAGVSEEFLRSLFKFNILSEKVREAITADLPREQEQVWARHILVADEATAKEVEAKLANGEDFGQLAAEYSTDEINKDNSGDLGWFAKGVMDPAFEEAAFALKVGEISQPVQSSSGWHIIQALGHEDRPLSNTEYEQLKDTKFSEWIQTQRTELNPEIIDTWIEKIPVKPTVPPELLAK
jgi:peptidyl-prolyl cis-trans isomerase D